MKTEILKALTGGGYISGQQLSESLGITRAAVWKHISSLREDGCVVDAHTNRGYKLLSIPDLLKPEYVRLYIEEPEIQVKWLTSVGSTNDYAKDMAHRGAPNKSIVIAEHQTHGKGRLSREWVSSPHEAVMLSIVFRPKIPPRDAPGINFAVALGVAQAIFEACGVKTGIKWPNDIVYDGKKICGILTEMTADMDSVQYAVSGMGINANQQGFYGEALKSAISLRMIKNEKIDRQRLCAAIIGNVLSYYDRFEGGGFAAIMDEYNEKSAVLGKEIKVLYGTEVIEGVCSGFAADGRIIVRIDGSERLFGAGEVSVRGTSDYV